MFAYFNRGTQILIKCLMYIIPPLSFRISGSGVSDISGCWKITPCQLDISLEVCLQLSILLMKEKTGNLSSLKVLEHVIPFI